MKMRRVVAGTLAAALFAVGAWAQAAEMSEGATRTLAEGNAEFALRLYENLRAGEGNLFFSPHSISTALAMTYAGAAGTTAEQMAKVLAFGLPADELHRLFAALQAELHEGGRGGAYELRVANALWGQEGFAFLEEFLALLQQTYDAPLRRADFMRETEGTRQTINDWVDEATNGKIKDLIGRGVLNALTRLVLTNAIYFRGFWDLKFDKDATEDAPFTLADGSTADVPLMRREDDFAYAETSTAQILELPYRGGDLSMVVVLPREADGLPALEGLLSPDELRSWLQALTNAKVSVFLPRFEITTQFSLARTLKAMGMTDAFSVKDADFSGMTGERDLYISAVVHKAFVAVDEEGTEAAAATGVVMALRSTAVPRSPRVFRADHPFLFLIRHKASGAVLFLGRVNDPRR